MNDRPMMGAVSLTGKPVLFTYSSTPQVPACEISLHAYRKMMQDLAALNLWHYINRRAAALLWFG